jgi:hypothetical protein
MASELDKISQAFRSLAAIDFPASFLAEAELAFVNAHLDATKAKRAKHLLATRGRAQAAQILGCSEAQVYRLANLQTIPPNSAELETG